jgi:eukaryotic-like serine/threonine-protein kinase
MDHTLADPLVGRVLDGRYAVTTRIAHGGMATVYLAMDTRLERDVALKVMHAELARDDDFVRRFIGEAKSVARLSHQNVVAVFDQGADGPFLYLAMEYVPGRTLKEVLLERGRFSPAAALDIMTGVLDGLAAAHASGIVHRDVKPENVLLTADGRIKVADFGLARAHAAAGSTRAGQLIGTVAYLAPEQVTGDGSGPRSDVYSAGVMLFELLTGRPPFTGDTPLSVAYQHVNQDIPAPSRLVPGIPAAADQLVLAATRRNPALRPADAGEFARAVRQVRQGLGEPSGLTGVTGTGVQGLSEAPWLDLATPAATNGWWARDAAATPMGAEQFGTGRFGTGAPDSPGSHTLIVDRGEDRRYLGGGREPFLQRWLFSPRLGIIALILVLVIGLGFGGWWLAAGRYAQVPTVAGDTFAKATAALTANGFTATRGAAVRSNEVSKGLVAGTRPSGRAVKGSAVAILISAGPFTSAVPNVKNDTLSVAEATLQRVHLVSTVQKVGSSAPVGTVLGTDPRAGTSWPQTKTVAILVSEGLTLPNFTGMNVQAAQQWASQHGANLQQQQNSNSQTQPGTITGQQPSPGSAYQQGETVIVDVSTGPPEVNVPNTIGMSVQQATQILQAAGFQVQVQQAFGQSGNRVWDYSPTGQAQRGSTITLYVISGNPIGF